MKISQIILKGVNNFKGFGCSFEDDWSKSVPDSILLMGPNGSGKTTLLKAIGSLWELLGLFLEVPNQTDYAVDHDFFNDCKLAALAIRDFGPEISPLVWIYLGEKQEVDRFLASHQQDYKVGGVWKAQGGAGRLAATKNIARLYEPSGDITQNLTSSSHWFYKLRERYIKNILGGQSDLPNLLFLESETRNLPTIDEPFSVIPEKETFTWLARYAPATRREGSIQNYLFTLKAINEEKYARIVHAANQFLFDKKISGFDPLTADLLITTHSGETHSADLLSSGEKQVLLMIAFIARELRPGGVVLIDEPDLHLHISLSTAFVSYLKRMVAEQNSQLLIASHAPELWERFTQTERVELGSRGEVKA